jgi:hypothetical protein
MAFAGFGITAFGADLGVAVPTTIDAVSAAAKNTIALQPLTWNVSLVDKNTGFPSPEFQRKWLKQFKVIEDQQKVNSAITPKSYIDAQVAAALSVANGYATTAQAAATTAAEAYTDTRLIPGIQLVSALPVAPVVNTRAVVSDATVATFGSALVGGGANTVPVVYTGSWIIG